MTSITIPTPTVRGLPPCNMEVISDAMHGSETSCLVKLFGPMHDCSFWAALAEMVMMAFKKSPADVWVAELQSGERHESSIGTRSWVCSQSTMPCPPSDFSRLIIFNSRSMTIGQSTCCSIAGTIPTSDLKNSSISSVFLSSSVSLTLVKYPAWRGSSGGGLLRKSQKSVKWGMFDINASRIDHVSEDKTSQAVYAYFSLCFSALSCSSSSLALVAGVLTKMLFALAGALGNSGLSKFSDSSSRGGPGATT